ncbi:hypothetical protein LUZ60_014839 [Juncus effusus]|nr:hypothetical protein LUZ60_014839 [Juncus effusus]
MAAPVHPPSPSRPVIHSVSDTSLYHAITHCTTLQNEVLLSPKLSQNPKTTLLRLLTAELRHLRRVSSTSESSSPLCSNVGHLSAVFHVINHPSVQSVSRICKPISPKSIHVDITCSFNNSPTWIFVSDRNPCYVSWIGSSNNKNKNRGFSAKVKSAIRAANETGALKPDKILFVFARGLEERVKLGLVNEFGAVEIDFVDAYNVFDEMPDGWIGICDEFKQVVNFKAFQIQIGEDSVVKDEYLEGLGGREELDLNTDFGSLLSKMRNDSTDTKNVINFDTTGLIAIISGISNGDAKRLLETSEDQLKLRFKSNYEFVIAQARSELENPILKELENVISFKKGIICQTVGSEFKELVSMCGGPTEKLRATQLLNHLTVVSDEPSDRVKALPTTRKLAMKNKIVFGTGDRWHAATVTANMGFVRAVSQTGMSLLTVGHRPRALTGV